jgi:hypothetical protein
MYAESQFPSRVASLMNGTNLCRRSCGYEVLWDNALVLIIALEDIIGVV